MHQGRLGTQSWALPSGYVHHMSLIEEHHRNPGLYIHSHMSTVISFLKEKEDLNLLALKDQIQSSISPFIFSAVLTTELHCISNVGCQEIEIGDIPWLGNVSTMNAMLSWVKPSLQYIWCIMFTRSSRVGCLQRWQKTRKKTRKTSMSGGAFNWF